eukprot:2200561-Lingulodinium_polyedra.AAC.1
MVGCPMEEPLHDIASEDEGLKYFSWQPKKSGRPQGSCVADRFLFRPAECRRRTGCRIPGP